MKDDDLPHHITDTNATPYEELRQLKKIELVAKLTIALHEIACLMQRCDHLAAPDDSDAETIEDINEHSQAQIDQSREAMDQATEAYWNYDQMRKELGSDWD